VLAPDVPVGQFHLTSARPAHSGIQCWGQEGVDGIQQHRLGNQRDDQLPFASQNCLRPGEELQDTATSDALAPPQPPSLMGRVASTRAAAETGVPTTVTHLARCVTVTTSAKAAVWLSGSVRRAYCTITKQ